MLVTAAISTDRSKIPKSGSGGGEAEQCASTRDPSVSTARNSRLSPKG